MDVKFLQTQSVGVLGFGQEGQAVTEYLLQHGITPVLFDKRPLSEFSEQEKKQLKEHPIETVLGPDYKNHLSKAQVIFRSPGVWRLLPELLAAEDKGTVITGQPQWFFDHCPAPIIGVTGTKGKGTTSSLIAHFLETARQRGQFWEGGWLHDTSRIFLTGNIGMIQPMEILGIVKPQDIVVYELSSFQLQDLKSSPQLAVVLMITADHLDVHATVQEYHEAKRNIAAFQAAEDFVIINQDYPASAALGNSSAAKKYYFSRQVKVGPGAHVKEGKLVIAGLKEEGEIDLAVSPLRGAHNWENVGAATLAGLIAGATLSAVEAALPSFKGLHHRLERVATQDEIDFYDDSISTVPDTAIAALNSFSEPIILILGGSSKGLDYSELGKAAAQAKNLKAVALIGTTAPQIKSALMDAGFNGQILQGYDNLRQAMKAIKNIAAAGDVVLLSPASGSLDWYKNYKIRGEDFTALAKTWNSL